MSIAEIKDARVRLEVVLGGSTHTVEQIAGIGEGTIIELDTLAGEPVEIRAGGEPIATGEVVVIDENFGVRVTGLITRSSAEGSDG